MFQIVLWWKCDNSFCHSCQPTARLVGRCHDHIISQRQLHRIGDFSREVTLSHRADGQLQIIFAWQRQNSFFINMFINQSCLCRSDLLTVSVRRRWSYHTIPNAIYVAPLCRKIQRHLVTVISKVPDRRDEFPIVLNLERIWISNRGQ